MTNRMRALTEAGLTYAPGVWDGLTALLADQAGFEALCVSGFAVSASLGLPDAEIYSMEENLGAARRVRGATSLPLVADIDTGYGNAINAARTARLFWQAGVEAVFMEDQLSPKRCPVCVDDAPELITLEEGVGKIRAIRDEVGDELFLIARTDGVEFDEIARRGEAYVRAGADMVMPISRGLPDAEAWRRVHDAVGAPLMCSVTAWTWVEREFTPEVLEQIGVRLALLPTQVLLAAAGTVRSVLQRLRDGEPPADVSGDHMPHKEFIDLIGFAQTLDRQAQYMPADV